MPALTIAWRERVRYPQSIFIATTPLTGRLVRIFKADITAGSKQQTRVKIRSPQPIILHKGPCTNYITLEGWGWGRRCVISVILGWCGGWIVRYITQGNKWFMVHNAHFILTPPVVLKTDIITYITFTVCPGAALCLQMMV